MKKRLLAMLLSALMVANISACSYAPENEIDGTFENIDTTESNFEETEKATESEKSTETVDIESAYDPAIYMRYTLNDDGNSYSVCPSGLPDVIKELVFPGGIKDCRLLKLMGSF